MKHTILIVGAGQLGSRYLQGLVSSLLELQIIVVDPSSESLHVAKKRWSEVFGEDSNHKIVWAQSIPENMSNIDLAIIATSSKNRAFIISEIKSKINIRYWIVEKVLEQSVEKLEAIREELSSADGCWVNTSRRVMDWYQLIKSEMNIKSPTKIKKVGGLWGLACNAIHFIDLVSWLTNEQLISVDTAHLDDNWLESKRSGYFEITGELIAHYSNGTMLSLESYEHRISEPLSIQISDGDGWNIDEEKGLATSSSGKKTNGRILYQSELTAGLVDNILNKGTCELPSLEESIHMHKIFISAMLLHWNISNSRNDLLLPIT